MGHSTPANHVLTHLYNTQESHIPYSKNSPVEYINKTFLNATQSGGQTNYLPRVILVDYRGAWGLLNKFEFFDLLLQVPDAVTPSQFSAQFTPKHPYQAQLDAGGNTKGLLTLDNVKYWLDYCKLVHDPRLLVSLVNYELSGIGGVHRHFEKSHFDTYDKGEEEYKLNRDDVDETFRRNLELCDAFQGLQLMTHLDQGWSGYSLAFLTDILDEYFNNNNKVTIWGWCFMEKEIQGVIPTLSRTRGLIEHANLCSLQFLIQPDWNLAGLGPGFESQNLWHTLAVELAWINGMWGVINKSSGPTSMLVIEDNVVAGTKRNIVNRVVMECELDMMDVDFDYTSTSFSPPTGTINLGLNGDEGTYYSKNYINNMVENANCYSHPNINEVFRVDTFPDILRPIESLGFHVTLALADNLKQLQNVLKRSRNYPGLGNIIEDPSELIEQISLLVEEYSQYEDEDEDWE